MYMHENHKHQRFSHEGCNRWEKSCSEFILLKKSLEYCSAVITQKRLNDIKPAKQILKSLLGYN